MSASTNFKVLIRASVKIPSKDDREGMIDARRVSLPGKYPKFDQFQNYMKNYAAESGIGDYSIKYRDFDNDFCTITNQEEWQAMVEHVYENRAKPTIWIHMIAKEEEPKTIDNPKVDKEEIELDYIDSDSVSSSQTNLQLKSELKSESSSSSQPTIDYSTLSIAQKSAMFGAPTGYLAKTARPNTMPLYRFHDHDTDDTILEVDNEDDSNRQYKLRMFLGYIFGSEEPGTIPLYEYYNPDQRDHLYTIDLEEIGLSDEHDCGKFGYYFKNILGYVYPPSVDLKFIKGNNIVPLYRYWGKKNTDHFYSTDPDEIGTIIPLQIGKNGYICEGPSGSLKQLKEVRAFLFD